MKNGTAIRFSEVERHERLRILLTGVDRIPNAIPLSVEDTLNLIGIHLRCKRADRLPMLAVMAVFQAAKSKLGERVLNLMPHNAADEVREYARSKYDETGGVEFAILDCTGFIRHFLHLFHRLRKDFLDQYQILVLREPDSAVSQALKEAFLALRQAAESAD